MKSYFFALVIVLGLMIGCSAPAPQQTGGEQQSSTAQAPAEQPAATPQPVQPQGDALVPGTDFNATGQITCSMGGGATGNCDFGVKREGNGSGMVTVTKPDGSKRVIFFENGKATGFDQSQADKGLKFSATKKGDMTIVNIGQERYEIFDAVIYGG
ncbi:MAG: hypothetical protein AB7H86_22575 [Blastocatellales bacterium]